VNFIKKYLKFTGIMFINLVISYILALFLFENTPWKNDIAGVFESPESLSLLISTILFMIFALYYSIATKKFVKYLKVTGIIIVIFVISIHLGDFFFENTPWINAIDRHLFGPDSEALDNPAALSLLIFFTISLLYYSFATKKFAVLIFVIGTNVFAGLIALLLGVGVTSENLEEYKWFIIIGCIPVVLIIMVIMSPEDRNKQCAWCGSSKIKFKSGNESDWFWEFRNKDGSRDKRVKDNFQRAFYNSEFECNECSATTKFIHFADKKPGKKVLVWKRTLLTEGNNDRKGTNWEDSSRITIHTNQANRKN